jgi:ABC-2 type transport system permease protein
MVAAEARAEFLKNARLPMFVVPTLAFPVMFYVLFALALGAGRTAAGSALPVAAYMVATYGTFGVMGAAFAGVGIGIAVERGQGWLTVKRASPMPGIAYFAAKMAMSMAFAAIIVALLFTLAVTLGGVRMPAASWGALALVLVVGALPFCALGCALGLAAGPNAAPAIANLLYLPMAFASGLWIPLEVLPSFFRRLAPALPPYHLARLALGMVGGARAGGAAWGHLAALAGFTALFAAMATAAYRRDEGRTYG